jgi:transposase
MLIPDWDFEIPELTRQVAKAAFPKGNILITVRDELGPFFEDKAFHEIYPAIGQPTISPARLALVTILQYIENLSDRAAADAVRSRIDWKYMLGLELDDAGFHYSVLSEFRARLLDGDMELGLFETLLVQFESKGLLQKKGQQRTDSTHILGAVRRLNRVELVGETMRQVLNTIAVIEPDWMLQHSDPEWVNRYGTQMSDYRLPKGRAKRKAYAEVIGQDGLTLLQMLDDMTTPEWLRQLPAVQVLRRVWIENYTWDKQGRLRWREDKERPPAAKAIWSPYDHEAQFSKKRTTSWVGYKVHFTETCDEDLPRLITHVETTPAPVSDIGMTPPIHEALREKGYLPETHLVDSGYVNADALVNSQQVYEVDLVGPTRPDTGWQSRADNGFAARDFAIDWENKQASCPDGKRSVYWTPAINNKGKSIIQIHFSKLDCRPCHLRPQCTRTNPPRRGITVQPQAQHKALLAAREREKTKPFSEVYSQRAGVEGTFSQGTRVCGLRQARYIGLAKTHLQHLFTAMAINILRVGNWLAGIPLAQTRNSAFVRLHAAAQTT